MKSVLAAGVACIVLVCSSPALAQQQAASDPTPASLAAARRLVEITTPDMEKQILTHMRQAVRDARFEEIDPDVGLWMEKNAGPLLLPHLRSFMEDVIRVYATRLTTEELNAMLAFYETPLGATIAEKQVALGLEVGTMTEPLMQRYAEDLFTRLCSDIDCEAMGGQGNAAAKPARR